MWNEKTPVYNIPDIENAGFPYTGITSDKMHYKAHCDRLRDLNVGHGSLCYFHLGNGQFGVFYSKEKTVGFVEMPLLP